ncbi:MAG: YggT family protein [Actinomycetota bacterium]
MLSHPLCLLLNLYFYILLARIILSFVNLFRPGWTPPSGLRPVLDVIYGLTEPPIKFLRRFIPQPLGLPIDLAFLAWFIILQVIGVIVGCPFGF